MRSTPGSTIIHLQDQAVTESMGAVTDHAFEHLGPSDQMIARTRRRLLQARGRLRDKATPPPGIADPGVFRGARKRLLSSAARRAPGRRSMPGSSRSPCGPAEAASRR